MQNDNPRRAPLMQPKIPSTSRRFLGVAAVSVIAFVVVALMAVSGGRRAGLSIPQENARLEIALSAIPVSSPVADARLRPFRETGGTMPEWQLEVARAVKLKGKVLRTLDEKNEFYAMLSSRELLAGVRSALMARLHDHGRRLDETEEKLRMDAVEFLAGGLSWSANPLRRDIARSICEILEQPLPAATGLYRSSVIGDRVELYGILALSSPGDAAALALRAKGTPAERIYQFSAQYFELNQTRLGAQEKS